MAPSLRIGLIGDYQPTSATHQATAALHHTAAHLGLPLQVQWLPTTALAPLPADLLSRYDALWCAPGSPYQSLAGALGAIRWARERDWPLLGTCAGFQHMVLEYARHVLGIAGAQHAEYGTTTMAAPLLVTPLSCALAGQTLEIALDPASRVGHIYQRRQVQEAYYWYCHVNGQGEDGGRSRPCALAVPTRFP